MVRRRSRVQSPVRAQGMTSPSPHRKPTSLVSAGMVCSGHVMRGMTRPVGEKQISCTRVAVAQRPVRCLAMADAGVRLPSAALDPPGSRRRPPRHRPSPRRVLPAGVAQWQSICFPSRWREFNSPHPLGPQSRRGSVLRKPIAVGYPPEGCDVTRVTSCPAPCFRGGWRGGTTPAHVAKRQTHQVQVLASRKGRGGSNPLGRTHKGEANGRAGPHDPHDGGSCHMGWHQHSGDP